MDQLTGQSVQGDLVILNKETAANYQIRIIGDDNLIFYGDGLEFNRTEIPPGAVQQIERRYRAKLATLRDSIERQKLAAAQQWSRIEQIRRETRAAVLQAEKLQADFSRIDFQQSSALYQDAYRAFQNGDFDRAILLLDDARLEAQDRKYADNRKLKARLHAVNFEFERAAENFERAIRIYESIPNYRDYADFLLDQNQSHQLAELYTKALVLAQSNLDSVRVLNDLSYAFSLSGQPSRSIQLCALALSTNKYIHQSTADGLDPFSEEWHELYTEYWRSMMDGIVILIKDYQLETAREYLEGAMDELEALFAYYPKSILTAEDSLKAQRVLRLIKVEMTQIQTAYALFYSRTDTPEAGQSLLLELEQEVLTMPGVEDAKRKDWEAMFHSRKGALFESNDQPDSALVRYQLALNSYRDLATKNPERFVPEALAMYESMATVFLYAGLYDPAQEQYRDGLAFLDTFKNEGSFPLTQSRASLLLNYGIYLNIAGKPKEADRHLREAIELYTSLEELLPESQKLEVMAAISMQANSLRKQQQFDRSREYSYRALRLAEKFLEDNPSELINYHMTLSGLHGGLGALYVQTHEPDSAILHLKTGIGYFEKLPLELRSFMPARLQAEIARGAILLGGLLYEQAPSTAEKKEAEQYFEKAMEIADQESNRSVREEILSFLHQIKAALKK